MIRHNAFSIRDKRRTPNRLMTTTTNPVPTGREKTASALSLFHLLDPEVLATVFDQGRMNQGYDAHVLLPAIRCPVLLLQADPEAGGLTPHEEMAPALALLPRGKHVFLKGVSHAWLHD